MPQGMMPQKCERSGEVEREAVVGDPAFYGDADCGDLALAYPDAGESGAAAGGEPERAHGVDEHLLKEAEVGVEVALRVERHDGVADDLAGAVVSDVAAAAGLREGDAACRALCLAPKQVLLCARAPSECEDGVVLGKNERVAYFARDSLGDECFLPCECVCVSRPPPIDHGERGRSVVGRGGIGSHVEEKGRLVRRSQDRLALSRGARLARPPFSP